MKPVSDATCIAVVVVLLIALSTVVPAGAKEADCFRIDVLDSDTGRGVPLVELTTTDAVRYYTDSNGIVAINDPELMGQTVFFHVRSHGYEYPADDFGYRGSSFEIKAGGRGEIRIKRHNIAERMYRITGSGIYRDSILVGEPVPIRQPLLNGKVVGQDSVHAVPYKGRIFWLWGDTSRAAYPLGNFNTSCATSLPPERGGLDPSRGIDLTYWVDDGGFSRKMMPMEGTMPVWLSALVSVKDAAGQEQLFAKYARVHQDMSVNEYGMARWNDDKAVFEKAAASTAPLFPDGHPFHCKVIGREYVYFQATGCSEPVPLVRARALAEHIADSRRFEGFTCLETGARYDGRNTRLDRDAGGKLIYAWKPGTPPLNFDQRKELVSMGVMNAGESAFPLRDIETGAEIKAHGGSVFWNPFRKRWVMIAGQAGGTSYLGELWFAEADTPVGPWAYARKIVTHDRYSFYNPTQHPFFDQEGGRLIYFEGTYTNTFSGNSDKTPRYDYNQVMYRLALDDPRLCLPAPVYTHTDGAVTRYAMRGAIAESGDWSRVQGLPFFAVPPERRREGMIPVYSSSESLFTSLESLLKTTPAGTISPLFFALPPDKAKDEQPSADVVPLYEYFDAISGRRWYGVGGQVPETSATRSAVPLCRVWRNPSSVLALDPDAQPLPF